MTFWNASHLETFTWTWCSWCPSMLFHMTHLTRPPPSISTASNMHLHPLHVHIQNSWTQTRWRWKTAWASPLTRSSGCNWILSGTSLYADSCVCKLSILMSLHQVFSPSAAGFKDQTAGVWLTHVENTTVVSFLEILLVIKMLLIYLATMEKHPHCYSGVCFLL